MVIHNKFVGGNIVLDHIEGDHVYLKNELRDTTTDWFYWAFCVEGAQGREFTFHFESTRLGCWGPAVSRDLVSWHWHDQVSDDYLSFSYCFGKDETRVYFAHHMLHHPNHFFNFALQRERAKSQNFAKGERAARFLVLRSAMAISV